METETRSRPELRPVWTGRGDQAHPSPRTAALSATSPLYSAFLNLPSPMHPMSPGYDPMRAHERALVDKLDRFDHRGRCESQLSPTTARSLSPISEQTREARRDSTASLPLPRAPAPSPLSPTLMQYTGPQTLAAQTREILLGGLPDGLPRSPLAFSNTSPIHERRQSLPPSYLSGRRSSQQIRDDLQQRGHKYHGNSLGADFFVSAVALRRYSDSSSTDDDRAPLERLSEGNRQFAIRAEVRPSAPDRGPFLLKGILDIDALRATVPEPPPLSAGPRRHSSEVAIRSPLPTGRRRSSVAASARHGLGPDRLHNTNTVPIRQCSSSASFISPAANKSLQMSPMHARFSPCWPRFSIRVTSKKAT